MSPTISQQIVTPDTGYDGLSQVTVNAAALQYKVIDITRAPSTSIWINNPDTGYIGFQSNAVQVKNGVLLEYERAGFVTSWSVDLGYYTNTSFYIMVMAHGNGQLNALDPSSIIAFCAKVTNNVVSWESAIGRDATGTLRRMGTSLLTDGSITISGTTLNIKLPSYNNFQLQMEPYYITYQIMSIKKKETKTTMIINANQGGGGQLQARTVIPSTSQQVIEPESPYYGLSTVTVEPAPLEATRYVNAGTYEQHITPESPDIGLSEVVVNPAILETRTVSPSTSQQTITKTKDDYYGLSQVVITPATLQTKDATLTKGDGYDVINADSSYYGLQSVRVPRVESMVVKSVSTSGSVVTSITIPDIPDSFAPFVIYLHTNYTQRNINQIKNLMLVILNGEIYGNIVDMTLQATATYLESTDDGLVFGGATAYIDQIRYSSSAHTLVLRASDVGTSPQFASSNSQPYNIWIYGTNTRP